MSNRKREKKQGKIFGSSADSSVGKKIERGENILMRRRELEEETVLFETVLILIRTECLFPVFNFNLVAVMIGYEIALRELFQVYRCWNHFDEHGFIDPSVSRACSYFPQGEKLSETETHQVQNCTKLNFLHATLGLCV